MPGRNLGVDRKVKLAEMTALPPITQMIADAKGLGSLGSRRGNMSVHGKNLAREFHPFHYLQRNRIAKATRSCSVQEEITMSKRFRFQLLCAGLLAWFVTLLTWLLARSLNMPESLVHATYAFVFAQVRIVETSVGRSLCSTTRVRRLLEGYRRSPSIRNPK
jgi:hypothetical protein